MRWKIEDSPERAAFREQFRGWLREVLPDGWLVAVDAGDYAAFDKIRSAWDVGQWQRTIGASGYGAPLWPKEYGGLSGEPWMQAVVREELSVDRLGVARQLLQLPAFDRQPVELARPRQVRRDEQPRAVARPRQRIGLAELEEMAEVRQRRWRARG